MSDVAPTPLRFAAVLFDMDGVIVDNMPLHRQVWLEFARRHGLDPSDADLRKLDGRRAADIIESLFGTGLSPERVAELGQARESYYRETLETETLVAVTGAASFLQALARQGIPRVLATSATPGNAAVVLERLALAPLFDAVVTAADVMRGKPDPEVYATAARRVGVLAADCLVVEDALPGIASGIAAGARCLGLATSEPAERLLAAGAHWTAPHFEDLPPALAFLA